jgi:hypothetical protein
VVLEPHIDVILPPREILGGSALSLRECLLLRENVRVLDIRRISAATFAPPQQRVADMTAALQVVLICSESNSL